MDTDVERSVVSLYMVVRAKQGGIELPEGEWLRLQDILARLHGSGIWVGRNAVRDWVRRRRVRAVKVVGIWYINWDDVVARVKKNWEPDGPQK